ncbi:inositol monophosphatase family protein [Weissella coleopterorum]|uniref:Inositol monophosphatase family protein n=1 Tax=Weissella coleopterorum TaxID=2714949 RepID=A0A6G8B0E5_9LACO|nr:inositol monophosphatase family protein [Weissella coleopterorum]QIL50685.1 inositol monophosphatase family protein [Weissella coleopterorum]
MDKLPVNHMQLDRLVLDWMAEVRTYILKEIQRPIIVNTKSNMRDLVTNLDQNVEKIYIEKIKQYDPNAQILSEEGFGDEITDLTGPVWIIDPIDGTMNFIKQRDEYASMLAYFYDGQAQGAWIMDVVKNEIVHGGPFQKVWLNQNLMEPPVERSLEQSLLSFSGIHLLYDHFQYQTMARAALGYRVYGSAGISFIRLLKGQLGGFTSVLKPWDFAAGLILCQALGLQVKTLDGQTVNVLSSNVILAAQSLVATDIKMLTNTSSNL